MPVRGRLLPLLALSALLVACGGATSTTTTHSAAPAPPATGSNAVTISPFDAGTGETTAAAETSPSKPAFPAPTPSGVLALAAQHPNGRVVYATVLNGSQGELTLARLGDKGLVAVTGDAGTTRVGLNLADIAGHAPRASSLKPSPETWENFRESSKPLLDTTAA